MKILEIDDNTDIISFVEMIITSMGHEFESVTNGRDGVTKIKENKYDLVLLDLSMPEFSGADVINELVKWDLINKQKIVLFTASLSGAPDQLDTIKKHIDSVLAKPVDMDVLMAKINEMESKLTDDTL